MKTTKCNNDADVSKVGILIIIKRTEYACFRVRKGIRDARLRSGIFNN